MRTGLALYRLDLRRVLREPITFWLLFAFVVLSTAITVMAWPASDSLDMARVARRTTHTFAYGELVLVLVLVPSLAITVLEKERSRVWDLLATSLAEPATFALSRAGTIATVAMLAIASTTPLLASLYLLGGISIREILDATVVLAVTGISTAAIAVAVWFYRTRRGEKGVVAYVMLSLLVFHLFVSSVFAWIDAQLLATLAFAALSLAFLSARALRFAAGQRAFAIVLLVATPIIVAAFAIWLRVQASSGQLEQENAVIALAVVAMLAVVTRALGIRLRLIALALATGSLAWLVPESSQGIDELFRTLAAGSSAFRALGAIFSSSPGSALWVFLVYSGVLLFVARYVLADERWPSRDATPRKPEARSFRLAPGDGRRKSSPSQEARESRARALGRTIARLGRTKWPSSTQRARLSRLAARFLERVSRGPRSNFTNPVFAHEIKRFELSTLSLGIVAPGAPVAVIFPRFVAWTTLEVVPLYLPVLAMLVPLLRTRGGLDELRSTPLRARDVMWGSALSVATPGIALLVVGSLAHLVACTSAYLDGAVVPIGTLFVYPWTGALLLGSTIAIAIFSASVARSILEARVFAFTALFAWLVVAPAAFGGPILDANPFVIYHRLDIVNFALRRRFASIALPDHPFLISLAYGAVIAALLFASHAIFARRGFPAVKRSAGKRRRAKAWPPSASGAPCDR